jgi:hypothetical protein
VRVVNQPFDEEIWLWGPDPPPEPELRGHGMKARFTKG